MNEQKPTHLCWMCEREIVPVRRPSVEHNTYIRVCPHCGGEVSMVNDRIDRAKERKRIEAIEKRVCQLRNEKRQYHYCSVWNVTNKIVDEMRNDRTVAFRIEANETWFIAFWHDEEPPKRGRTMQEAICNAYIAWKEAV